MSISIQLDKSSFDCLSTSIPAVSPLRQLFQPRKKDDESGYVDVVHARTGMPMAATLVQVYCSEDEGQELLGIAQTHCTDAVHSIKEALAGR